MNAHRTWALDVVDDGLELPGWVLVPAGLSGKEREAWRVGLVEEITGTPGWNGEPVTADEARDIVATGLALRESSDALAMFQVLPAVGGETVNCFINVLPSAELLDWRDFGLVQAAEAAHIGPGLQCSTRRTIEAEGNLIEVAGVHLVFDDGDTSLVFSLDETLAPLISSALLGFLALVQHVGMVGEDGRRFASLPPAGVPPEDVWPLQEDS